MCWLSEPAKRTAFRRRTLIAVRILDRKTARFAAGGMIRMQKPMAAFRA
jgi:hypothetical protein